MAYKLSDKWLLTYNAINGHYNHRNRIKIREFLSETGTLSENSSHVTVVILSLLWLFKGRLARDFNIIQKPQPILSFRFVYSRPVLETN